jgi:hypothetical protein
MQWMRPRNSAQCHLDAGELLAVLNVLPSQTELLVKPRIRAMCTGYRILTLMALALS